ncbi:MAG TPA: GxxExxY protein [Candidatus Didemnitutus sp.]|nr:GxxExxY protein [Candidatus Didemnitutus sp.]
MEALTGQIIGAAIEVHKEIGPGYLQTVYEEALCVELTDRRLPFLRQVSVPIHYRQSVVGQHRLDLLVADCVVVELKAISGLEDIHFAVVRSYLKATGRRHGLILNFAGVVLQAKRVGRELSGR